MAVLVYVWSPVTYHITGVRHIYLGPALLTVDIIHLDYSVCGVQTERRNQSHAHQTHQQPSLGILSRIIIENKEILCFLAPVLRPKALTAERCPS